MAKSPLLLQHTTLLPSHPQPQDTAPNPSGISRRCLLTANPHLPYTNCSNTLVLLVWNLMLLLLVLAIWAQESMPLPPNPIPRVWYPPALLSDSYSFYEVLLMKETEMGTFHILCLKRQLKVPCCTQAVPPLWSSCTLCSAIQAHWWGQNCEAAPFH